MKKTIVIGAGPMGLAAAYQAARDGHEVELVEAAPEPGGMAAHFDFGGLSIEKFYHFVCRADLATFEILKELGLSDKLKWVETSMGHYVDGDLQRWGDPIALFQLKGVSLITKLRYGAFVFLCSRRNDWSSLEHVPAKEWIRNWCGREGYEKLWSPLLDYKFYEYAGTISARWIWTRIRRVGRSRKSIMQEELGYIEGGSQTLVDALMQKIEQSGAKIRFGCPVQRVVSENGEVRGIETPQGFLAADYVISTIPVQQVPKIVPELPQSWLDKYASIKNIGICCVILKLNRKISEHFWINIKDETQEIPGVIEFSNLRPVGENIVYVPYYLPLTNPKFQWSDEKFIGDAMECVSKLNPAISLEDVIDAKVSRLRYAQPICDVGFAGKIPPVQTPIRGLQIADTCFYYPEDRGISESVALGRQMARNISRTE